MKKVLFTFVLLVSSMTFGQAINEVGEEISYGLGDTLTGEYQSTYPEEPFAYLIGRDIIDDMLRQEGVQGLRIYEAIDPSTSERRLVFIGVDADGDNVGWIADMTLGYMCPPFCNIQKPRPPSPPQ